MLNLSFIFLSWCTLVINRPYIMALLFAELLLFATCVVGFHSKFVGLIMFLIYVGGIMVLLSYCVMLLPVNKFRAPGLFVQFIILFPLSVTVHSSYTYGLVIRFGVIFLLGLVLFFVMLCVVDIVDYSRGMIYVKYVLLLDF